MIYDSLNIIKTAVSACVNWTNQLFAATGGGGIVLAAFCIVLIIGLLFIPLRGGNIVADWSTVRDFNMGVIHKGKYQSGKWKLGSRSTVHKGQFESGNTTARLSRRGRHTRYYAGGSGKQGI